MKSHLNRQVIDNRNYVISSSRIDPTANKAVRESEESALSNVAEFMFAASPGFPKSYRRQIPSHASEPAHEYWNYLETDIKPNVMINVSH